MNYLQIINDFYPYIKRQMGRHEYRACELLNIANQRLTQFLLQDKTSFNVFNAMHVEKKEVITHSSILFYLLTYYDRCTGRSTYLDLFLKALNIPDEYRNLKWQVYKEKYFNHGRIDFVIESSRMVIAIEMKIDANDQPQQLERYEMYCISRHKDYRIYYLTLDGKEASKQSCGNVNMQRLHLISFESTILSWLRACITTIEKSEYKFSFLHQYLAVVQYLTEKEEVNDILKEFIKTPDDAKSVIVLIAALYEIMEKCMRNLYRNIKRELENKGLPPMKLDEDAISNFYYKKINTFPSLVCDLDQHLYQDGRRITFSLVIETESKLYYCLSFLEYDKNGNKNYIPWKSAKRKCEWLFDKWHARVSELKLENSNSSPNSILWAYLLNSKGEEINFNEYNDAALALIENSDEEAIFMSDYLFEVLRDLSVTE